MPQDYQLLPTPNPEEFALVVHCEAGKIIQHGLPKVGQRYVDCPQVPGWRANEGPPGALLRDYVYAEQRGDLRRFQDNHEPLLFVKARSSDEERNTPFRTYWAEFGTHSWPDILTKLELHRDDSFPIVQDVGEGQISSPRYYVNARYIPGMREGSRFLVEEFLSDTIFNIPQYPVPMPGAVMGETLTTEYHFPECLHDDLVIQDMQTGTTRSAGGASEANCAGVIPGQYHPRTNFITWQPYVIQDSQRQESGLWYRKRVRVFPPPLPRERVRRA